MFISLPAECYRIYIYINYDYEYYTSLLNINKTMMYELKIIKKRTVVVATKYKSNRINDQLEYTARHLGSSGHSYDLKWPIGRAHLWRNII